MPCITEPGTADKVAQLFCSNGRNKEQAMLDADYAPVYARSGRGKNSVYSNELVKQAIAKIDAKTSAKLEHDRDKAIAILHEALAIARKDSDCKGIVSACRELDAISRLHSQTILTDKTEQAELDAQRERMVQADLNRWRKEQGPQLHKDAG